MRKTNQIYEQDSMYDLIQKTGRTRRTSLNFKTNFEMENKNFMSLIERRRASKISHQANLYLSEMVNDIKETIVNLDDNIFLSNVENNQKNEGENTPNHSISKVRNLNINPLNPNKTIHSQINILNHTNNSNKINKKNELSLINQNNNNQNNQSVINNNQMFRNNSITTNRSNQSNKSLNDNKTFSIPSNSNKLLKKSSLRAKDFKKINTNNLFMRTSTVSRNQKSVKFDLAKTSTFNYYPKKEIKKLKKLHEFSYRGNKDKEKGLFPFTQREEKKEDFFYYSQSKTQLYSKKIFNNTLLEGNEKLFNINNISNKKIVELNEISMDLKKSLILTPSNLQKTILNIKKPYLLDNNEDFDELNKENNNNEEDEKILHEKYRDLQKKGLVYDSLDDIDDENISKYFIHPDSKILLILDFLLVICIFYDLIYIPLYLGNNDIYCRRGSFINFINIFEIIINSIYFFDFSIYFFVGFYDDDDILRTGLRAMFFHYLKHWFIVNLISVIPFKTIFIIFDTSCQDIHFLKSYKYSSQIYYLLTSLRLVKTIRIFKNKFLNYIDEKLDKYEFYNNYLGLLKGIAIFILTLHVGVCIFIFLGRNDYPNWIINFNFEGHSFKKLYFIGIYYIITTVTTVGYGDLTCVTPKEKLFGIFIEIVGIIAYSWILTSISNYVKSKSDQEEEYFKKYKILEDIKMTYDDFSEDLFERIDRYIKHKTRNEDEEKQLIDELPIALKNNLVYSMYEPIIQNFVFFKNFDNKDFIVSVIFAFKPILAIKNDILIKEGEFVEDTIFVKKGKITLEYPVRIYQPTENIKNTTSIKPNNNFKFSTYHGTTFNINHLYSQTPKHTNFPYNLMGSEHNDHNDPFEENNIVYQRLKILDIRKNEHFGEVLMFSNERSPLSAVVKSRKAELFYLNKQDANEISLNYSFIWNKIEKKSIFNMKQIQRLMNRLEKIFYKKNGLTIKNTNEEFQNTNEDLKSIPTISDEEQTNNFHKFFKNKNTSKESYKTKMINLNTIKEVSQNEDGIEESLSSLSETSKKSSQKNIFMTKKIESGFDTESSRFNEASNKNADTIRQSEINTLNGFTQKFPPSDFKKRLKFSNFITPFKIDEINTEIYPNENFMQYDDSLIKKNYSIKSLKDSNNKNIENNDENNNNSEDNNNINIISENNSYINYIKDEDNNINKDNNNINNIKDEKNNISKDYNNINNISICSTEISFSIDRKYDNIDELSEFKYSKTPILRKKVKNIIIDFNEDNLDLEKGDKMKTKSSVSLKYIKKTDYIKKCSSIELLKRKKKKREKSCDNLNNNKIFKSKVYSNILDIVNDNIKKKQEIQENQSDESSFSQFFSNFLEKENKTWGKNKSIDEKEELSLKFLKLQSNKKNRTKMVVKHYSLNNLG